MINFDVPKSQGYPSDEEEKPGPIHEDSHVAIVTVPMRGFRMDEMMATLRVGDIMDLGSE